MKIFHRKSGVLRKAGIERVKEEDWETIGKSDQFGFNWLKEKEFIVYKLHLELEGDILGLIAAEDIPVEYRLHIRLIESSHTNKGKNKEYDGVAGCLIAKVCEIAFDKQYDGFVSLKLKTELEHHYMHQYGFRRMGQLLFTELSNSEALINKYLGDERI